MLAALGERENGIPVFVGFMGQPLPFTQEEIRASAIRTFLRNVDVTFIPNFVEDRLDDMIADILAQISPPATSLPSSSAAAGTLPIASSHGYKPGWTAGRGRAASASSAR